MDCWLDKLLNGNGSGLLVEGAVTRLPDDSTPVVNSKQQVTSRNTQLRCDSYALADCLSGNGSLAS